MRGPAFRLPAVGIVMVLLPLLVQAAIIYGLLLMQDDLDARLQYQRDLRAAEILMGKLGVADEDVAIALVRYRMAASPANFDAGEHKMQKVEKLAAELEDFSKKSPRLQQIFQPVVDINHEFCAGMRAIFQRGAPQDPQQFLKFRQEAPGQATLYDLVGKGSYITSQIEEQSIRSALAQNTDAQGTTAMIYLLVAGTALNFAVAGAGALWFGRRIVDRLRIVQSNCQTILQAGQLPMPLQGNDELAELDAEFYNAAIALENLKSRRLAVASTAADVIFSIDQSMRIITVSDACSSRWGYTPEYLTRRSVLDIIPEEQHDKVIRLIDKAVKEGEAEEEFTVRHRSGLAVEVSCRLRWNEKSDQGVGVAFDVTQKVANRKLLQLRTQQQQTMLEALPIGVMICEQNAAISGASLQVANIFQRPPAQIVGQPLPLLYGSSAIPGRSASPQEFWHKLVSASGQSVETLIRHGDDVVPYEAVGNKFATAGGQKLLVTFEDVSERYEMDRIRQELVSMVSHDLRTPLTSMMALLEMLPVGMYGQINETGLQHIDSANDAASTLLRLINELLDIDRASSNRMTIDLRPVALASVIQSCVSDLLELMVRLNVQMTPLPLSVPPVLGDEHRLGQTLEAVMHTLISLSEPGATLSYKARELDAHDAHYIDLFIGSTNLRADGDKLTALFDMYNNSELCEELQIQDLRLSLPLAQALVNLMKGTIAPLTVADTSGLLLRLPKASGS